MAQFFVGKDTLVCDAYGIKSQKQFINTLYDESTMAQFFARKDTLVCDAYGIKRQKQFINTLYDNIKFRGAMNTIITDDGKYEISKKVASLFTKQYESEPYHQHQTNLNSTMVL